LLTAPLAVGSRLPSRPQPCGRRGPAGCLRTDWWDLGDDLRPVRPLVRRGLHATLPWRQVVEAILWLARTGAQWRELSERYGSWSAVWLQWRRWRDKGVWDVGVRRLNADVRVSGGVMRSRAWSSSTQRPPGATLCLGVPREGWGGQL